MTITSSPFSAFAIQAEGGEFSGPFDRYAFAAALALSDLSGIAPAAPVVPPSASSSTTSQPIPPIAAAPARALTAEERHAANPRIRGREALTMELATSLPHLSADAIGAKVAAATGQGRRAGPSGLAAAVDEMIRLDAGLPPGPTAGAQARNGLAIAVDEMIAADIGEVARAPRSGLAAAVDELRGAANYSETYHAR